MMPSLLAWLCFTFSLLQHGSAAVARTSCDGTHGEQNSFLQVHSVELHNRSKAEEASAALRFIKSEDDDDRPRMCNQSAQCTVIPTPEQPESTYNTLGAITGIMSVLTGSLRSKWFDAANTKLKVSPFKFIQSFFVKVAAIGLETSGWGYVAAGLFDGVLGIFNLGEARDSSAWVVDQLTREIKAAADQIVCRIQAMLSQYFQNYLGQQDLNHFNDAYAAVQNEWISSCGKRKCLALARIPANLRNGLGGSNGFDEICCRSPQTPPEGECDVLWSAPEDWQVDISESGNVVVGSPLFLSPMIPSAPMQKCNATCSVGSDSPAPCWNRVRWLMSDEGGNKDLHEALEVVNSDCASQCSCGTSGVWMFIPQPERTVDDHTFKTYWLLKLQAADVSVKALKLNENGKVTLETLNANHQGFLWAVDSGGELPANRICNSTFDTNYSSGHQCCLKWSDSGPAGGCYSHWEPESLVTMEVVPILNKRCTFDGEPNHGRCGGDKRCYKCMMFNTGDDEVNMVSIISDINKQYYENDWLSGGNTLVQYNTPDAVAAYMKSAVFFSMLHYSLITLDAVGSVSILQHLGCEAADYLKAKVSTMYPAMQKAVVDVVDEFDVINLTGKTWIEKDNPIACGLSSFEGPAPTVLFIVKPSCSWAYWVGCAPGGTTNSGNVVEGFGSPAPACDSDEVQQHCKDAHERGEECTIEQLDSSDVHVGGDEGLSCGNTNSLFGCEYYEQQEKLDKQCGAAVRDKYKDKIEDMKNKAVAYGHRRLNETFFDNATSLIANMTDQCNNPAHSALHGISSRYDHWPFPSLQDCR